MRELLAEASTSQVSAMKLSIGRQLVTAGLGLAAETTKEAHITTNSNPPSTQNKTTNPNPPVESPRQEEVEDGMVLRPNISNRYNPRSFRSVYEEFHGRRI